MNKIHEKANEAINMRIKPSEKERWRQCAKEKKIPMSQFIIKAVNKACERLENE